MDSMLTNIPEEDVLILSELDVKTLLELSKKYVYVSKLIDENEQLSKKILQYEFYSKIKN